MFRGSMVALVTPMRQDGEVDYKALASLVQWHISESTDALVVLGTTGESPTITDSERETIIQFVLTEAAEKIPVIVGTGANCTKKAIHYTEQALSAGADAALIVTPYYNKPTQQGLFEHFSVIAKAVPLPIILYNVPGRTGCDLSNETVERLAAMPNVVGLKDATGQLDRAKDFIKRQLEMDLYSGDDATCMELMLAGGQGVISVVANMVPKLMHELAMAALSGDRATATQLNSKMAALYKASVIESNPIPSKWALAAMGKIEEGIRLPLTRLSEQHQTYVRSAMQEAEAL